jgi:excisionase family DNA binding protein
MAVADVARELGLSERRVRALIEEGRLPASRLGRSWLVSSHALQRFRRRSRPRGRPVSASNAWALLALLAGSRPDWVRSDVESRLRRYARDPESLVDLIEHSEPRGQVLSLWMPQADLPKLDQYRLVRSGLASRSARSELDLIPLADEPVDAYVTADIAEEIVKRFAPEESAEQPNVILRIPNVDWVSAQDEAPLSVAAADLLEHDDPRVRRAGEEVLRELAYAS